MAEIGSPKIPSQRTGSSGWIPRLLILCLLLAFPWMGKDVAGQSSEPDVGTEGSTEDQLIQNARQITFAGRRAGEGYFSADGTRMVFQSERDPSNPFYQIYWMDLGTGDINRVSTGIGKTTCAWIHPSGQQVLFASTHEDKDAVRKQEEELEKRRTGTQSRYSWDYDPNYELYSYDTSKKTYTPLTEALGYDAEASYSPDGSQIVFASNREAYARDLSDREKELFEIDPAFMMDLYIMNSDGSNVRRLTDVPGYDGGPFFSPDGQRICWRRFAENGATAEVYTMKTDGSDVRRLTEIGAMSWAPYFHPSGDYLIFTTNKHGFSNFELYLVRADGQGEPVRVTYTDGFDGLPVFLPEGDRVSWTTNRVGNKSQIFLGDWNDMEARKQLGLSVASPSQLPEKELAEDREAAQDAIRETAADYRASDVGRHVDYLTRPELGGRLTGTEGERKATAYVAAYLESLGFQPAGQDGTFFQEFEFSAGSELVGESSMFDGTVAMELGRDWNPLSFSESGKVDGKGVAFAGYGMVVPGSEDVEEYDSYVHLDVRNKWVLVFRDLPQDITPERRQQLARYSSPRRKASVARDRGAAGIIFVAGPTSKVQRQLIRFDERATQAGVSIGVVSITNDIAENWFHWSEKDLQKIQTELDDGSMMMGFDLPKVQVSTEFNIERRTGIGRNVLARLASKTRLASENGHPSTRPVVILGAHIDHLGRGGSSSLAREDEQEKIHVGADDNASGVAVMLEVAQALAVQQKQGKLDSKRDLLIAAWSGEELGLFGSQAFVDQFDELYPSHAEKNDEEPNPHAHHHVTAVHAHGTSTQAKPLTDRIAVYLNLDMVGRLGDSLIVQGLGSSPGFEAEVQRRNVPVGLSLKLDPTSTRLPTDASAFVGREVPILSGFTGAHEDYHTPRDTAEKLNYEGAAQIANLFGLLTRGFVVSDDVPEFKLEEGQQEEEVPRARLTAYLGTIPDYVAGEIKGAKLSGVAADGPAAKAGIQGGDVIVELAGKTIEDLYDYTYAIEALKIGEATKVVVLRGGEKVELMVTPGSRD